MGQPGWEGVRERMDTCICMAESLHCSPKTVTKLLIGYTPIENKKFILKKKEWNNAIYINMNGPRDCHTEWSKSKTNTICY